MITLRLRRRLSAHRLVIALAVILVLELVLPGTLLFRVGLLPSTLADNPQRGVAFKGAKKRLIGSNISIPALGSPVTQNFDTLVTTGTANAWADDTTLTGWFSQFTATPTNPTTYRADSGGSNTGAIYSWGIAGVNPLTERAFGSVASGTPGDIYNAIKLTNNTGQTITSLDVSYFGEQWRQAGCTPLPCTPAAQKLDFQYQVANAGVITDANTPTTGWVDEDPLDFTSPQPGTSTAAAIDGNAAANRASLSSTITVTISSGQEVWLRWKDINDANNDHGLGIDDFSVTANGGVVTPTLNIGDVTQGEGNSGTSTFSFQVSLTAPAGAGGVSFTVNTQDGTTNPANAGSDYVGITDGAGSITSGNSSTTVNVTVNGDMTNEPNETFFVNITNVTGATAGDVQGLGTISNDDAVLVPIHAIQGNGIASPLAGQLVTTSGIVTLLRTSTNNGGAASGFFLQTPDADVDADPNTSQGIFVFTSTVPVVAVGDEVTVSGTVTEFNELTEISTVTNVSILDTGNPLPTAVTLTPTILDPTALATQTQLEKFEGMRMTAASLTTVAPNDNFFDVDVVITGVPRPMREPGIEITSPVPPDPTTGTLDCCIPLWDENPERLSLDTNGRAGAALNPYTSNVVLTNVAGPLDYAFGRYRLVADTTPTASANMSAVPLPTPTADEFTIAGYNIENFNNNTTQRQKAALAIRDILRLPYIIGVAEIFDLADLQALAAEINAIAPGRTYEAHLIEADGVSEDSDQDVGYLVDTSRVQVNSVVQRNATETYINPNTGTPELLNDRPPLVLNANINPTGANLPVIVVVNHLRSFIDIELVSGEGPRVRAKRKAQAESLAALLQEYQTNNPTTSVISIGDYNAYQFSDGYTDPIATIKGNPTPDDQIVVDGSPDVVNPNFINLVDELPAQERYSFIFEGTPQALDHVIVNTLAHGRNTRFAIARNNADFPEVPAAAFASNAARPERNSDHDMPMAYFSLLGPQPAGSVLISEFRLRGPGPVGTSPEPNGTISQAENDEFVEIYNNTDSAITVSTTDGSSGWALAASNGAIRFTIPNGTVIPARGHYLGVNSFGYSLAGYPAGNGTSATGDITYTNDIPDNAGIALFNTANTANFALATRLDAVGSSSEANTLYKEGTGYAPLSLLSIQSSWVRNLTTGLPKDSDSNAEDFLFVDTQATDAGAGSRLGAPGPENLSSPIQRNATIKASLVFPCASSSASPNRVRDLTPVFNGSLGTLDIRRKFTNNTGGSVTRLRFRVVDITTTAVPPGTADLRVLTSSDVAIAAGENPCGSGALTLRGSTLEEPPGQPIGGGLNSSLSADVVTLGTPMSPGASINLRLLLGVQQGGTFRFFINVEALP